MESHKIVFYYPSRNIGGAQLLFIRCARYLVKTGQYSVSYIDYNDGYAKRIMSHEEVDFIDYESYGDAIDIADAFVILPFSFMGLKYKRIKPEGRTTFLLWVIQPGLMMMNTRFFGIEMMTSKEKRIVSEVLSSLSHRGVVKYMDYECYHSQSTGLYFTAVDVDYLPIPIENERVLSMQNFTPKPLKAETLTFLWLSRLDLDKEPTLLTVFNELEAMKSQYKIKLFVVGDGSRAQRIKQKAKKYSYEIEFTGVITGEALDEFIDTKMDIGVAMGTAALEIAKRGKPVIIKGFMPEPSAAGVLDDYICLNETYGFSLGTPAIQSPSQMTFKDKVNAIINSYESHSMDELKYVNENHTLDKVGKKLEDSISVISKLDTREINDKIATLESFFRHSFKLKLMRFLSKKITFLRFGVFKVLGVRC